eukprot:INCI11303.1.p1 GENE.INCI11303.1~~INCI11303.1.p1  ORF type:complete len:1674 (-),score=298.65 INCI11303.1:483-5504(-)
MESTQDPSLEPNAESAPRVANAGCQSGRPMAEEKEEEGRETSQNDASESLHSDNFGLDEEQESKHEQLGADETPAGSALDMTTSDQVADNESQASETEVEASSSADDPNSGAISSNLLSQTSESTPSQGESSSSSSSSNSASGFQGQNDVLQSEAPDHSRGQAPGARSQLFDGEQHDVVQKAATEEESCILEANDGGQGSGTDSQLLNHDQLAMLPNTVVDDNAGILAAENRVQDSDIDSHLVNGDQRGVPERASNHEDRHSPRSESAIAKHEFPQLVNEHSGFNTEPNEGSLINGTENSSSTTSALNGVATDTKGKLDDDGDNTESEQEDTKDHSLDADLDNGRAFDSDDSQNDDSEEQSDIDSPDNDVGRDDQESTDMDSQQGADIGSNDTRSGECGGDAERSTAAGAARQDSGGRTRGSASSDADVLSSIPTPVESSDQGDDSVGGLQEKIRVLVRLRPLSGEERADTDKIISAIPQEFARNFAADRCVVQTNGSRGVKADLSSLLPPPAALDKANIGGGPSAGGEISAASLGVNLRGARSVSCTYDCVLGTSSTQQDVYSAVGSPVSSVLKGINCTVLAYGQTGTGKTYTMLGDGIESELIRASSSEDAKRAKSGSTRTIASREKFNEAASGDTGADDPTWAHSSSGNERPASWGIVPRTLADLFREIEKLPTNTIATVTCSYLQVYNNNVFDLLQDPKRQRSLQLRERAAKVQNVDGGRTLVYVQGLSEFSVGSLDEVMELLRQGNVNRAIRATSHNEASSRSHAILQLQLELETTTTASNEKGPSTDAGDDGEAETSDGNTSASVSVIRRAKLNLVDLAGSEKYTRRKPTAGDDLGTASSSHQPNSSTTDIMGDAQLREMTNINSSLTALGLVIAALSTRSKVAQAAAAEATASGATPDAAAAAAQQAAAAKHVPYRNSALTRLLQDSLGGNTRTVLIATVSPCVLSFEETRSTLKFADRAHSVMTSVQVNEVVSDATLLRKARAEIQRLRRHIQTISGQGTLNHLDGTASGSEELDGRGSSGSRGGSRGSNGVAAARSLRKKNRTTTAQLARTEARLGEAESQLRKAVAIMDDQRKEIARLRELLGMSPAASPTHSPIHVPQSRTGKSSAVKSKRTARGSRRNKDVSTSRPSSSTARNRPLTGGRPPLAVSSSSSPSNRLQPDQDSVRTVAHSPKSKASQLQPSPRSSAIGLKRKETHGKSRSNKLQVQEFRAMRARQRVEKLDAERREAQRLKVLHRKTKIGGGGGGGGYQYSVATNRVAASSGSSHSSPSASSAKSSSPNLRKRHNKASPDVSSGSPTELGQWLRQQNFFAFTSSGTRASREETTRSQGQLEQDLQNLGVSTVADLAELEIADLEGTQLKQLQKRRLLRAARGEFTGAASPTRGGGSRLVGHEAASGGVGGNSSHRLTLPSLDTGARSPNKWSAGGAAGRAHVSTVAPNVTHSSSRIDPKRVSPSRLQAPSSSSSSTSAIAVTGSTQLSDSLSTTDGRRQRHLKLLMSQTGASETAAGEAYAAAGGDIASAIMRLFDAQTKRMMSSSQQQSRPMYQPSFLGSSNSHKLAPLTHSAAGGTTGHSGYGTSASYGPPPGSFGAQSGYGSHQGGFGHPQQFQHHHSGFGMNAAGPYGAYGQQQQIAPRHHQHQHQAESGGDVPMAQVVPSNVNSPYGY